MALYKHDIAKTTFFKIDSDIVTRVYFLDEYNTEVSVSNEQDEEYYIQSFADCSKEEFDLKMEDALECINNYK